MSGTALKEYAKQNGIDIKGLTRVDDIRTRILEAEAAKNSDGNTETGDNVPDGSENDDDTANQFISGDGENEGGGASK